MGKRNVTVSPIEFINPVDVSICPNCGMKMVIHMSEEIPGRSAPLNWYECQECGWTPHNIIGTITVNTDEAAEMLEGEICLYN